MNNTPRSTSVIILNRIFEERRGGQVRRESATGSEIDLKTIQELISDQQEFPAIQKKHKINSRTGQHLCKRDPGSERRV